GVAGAAGSSDLVRPVINALFSVRTRRPAEIALFPYTTLFRSRLLDNIAILVGCLDGNREGASSGRRSRHGVAGRGQAIGKTGEFKGEAGAAGSSDLVRTVINALLAVWQGGQVEIDLGLCLNDDVLRLLDNIARLHV